MHVVLQKQSERHAKTERSNHKREFTVRISSDCFETNFMDAEHLEFSPWKNVLDTKSIIACCTWWVRCHLNKNGKPVIASNINVFCFIITNKMVSMCVLHFTKVYCMLKKKETKPKKRLISNEFLHFLGLQVLFDSTSAHITHSQ